MIDVIAAAHDAPHTVSTPAAQPGASYEEQYSKARALAAAGQHDLAIALYTGMLARSPGNADLLLGRGLAHARSKRYAEAESDLRAAAAAAPGYADVWSALANLYVWSARPALALPAYDRLIALQPDEPAHRGARAAIAAALETARVPALAAPPGHAWSAALDAGISRVSPGNLHWNQQSFSIRRHFARGSLSFDTLRASRFGQHGAAWALDGYATVWNGAYANLRYQHGPSERLFPAKSWRAELFQSVGQGWELSASGERLHFGETTVDMYGIGIARYVGDFYVRLRHTNIVSGGARSSGDRLTVRYYYKGDADNYAELAASRGRSDDPLSLAGGAVQSGGASFSYVRYPTAQWGYRIGINYARQSGTGSERGLSGGLLMRW